MTETQEENTAENWEKHDNQKTEQEKIKEKMAVLKIERKIRRQYSKLIRKQG